MTEIDEPMARAREGAVEVHPLPSRDELARMLDAQAFKDAQHPHDDTVVLQTDRVRSAYKTADQLLAYFEPSKAALAASPSSEVAELRATNRDLHRRMQKAEGKMKRHSSTKFLSCAGRAFQEANQARQALAAAEAERDTALTAITDARQVLAEAECDRPFLDDGVRALVAERSGLRARVKVLEEALQPFSSFAIDNVDNDGWSGREQNASIRTWFGPSDFRRARVALSTAQDGDKEDGDA